MNTEKEVSDSDKICASVFGPESVKIIAESIGLNALPDDAAQVLSEDLTSKIKSVVQDALKFMNHSKRTCLLVSDIDGALKVRNLEALFGFHCTGTTPFRFAAGGGRELQTVNDSAIELDEVASCSDLKIPLDISLHSHWLAVDGEQPKIPENPVEIPIKHQQSVAVNPALSLDSTVSIKLLDSPWGARKPTFRSSEVVLVKQLATHELSVEQQLYYREITEACVGTDEQYRSEALQSLTTDPGLYEMLPRICTFISEGVKVNAVQNNLAMLIYLIRMVKALLDNPHFYIERYLHEIIPAVITCIVSKQLCVRPELDNHWALRDFAARLIARICKTFSTSTNNLQTRITRIFSKSLANEKNFLTTMYGSIVGFSELGTEVGRIFILPRLKFISDRIEAKIFGMTRRYTDKEAAEHIRSAVLKFVVPILLQMRNPPDFVEEYRNEFGAFLGPSLCLAVLKARTASNTPNSLPMGNTNGSRLPTTPCPSVQTDSDDAQQPD